MTAENATRRVELAHRTSDGIDVYLFWHEPTSRVTVGVVDARAEAGFELDVDGRYALDAFNHPYAYAARSGPANLEALVESLAAGLGPDSAAQDAIVDAWRTRHGTTDR